MKSITIATLAALSCGPFVSLACGGGGSGGPNGTMPGGDDAGDAAVAVVDGSTLVVESGAAEAAPTDHGAPSTTYPAFTPDMGQIDYNGGYVMTTPVIVPITWNGDRSQAKFDQFAALLGSTTYFHATTSEYLVMAAMAAPPVHLATAPPSQLSDTDIHNLITANAGVVGGDGGLAGDGAAPVPEWPAPTENTIYAFFLPPGMSLDVPAVGGGSAGDACSQGIGGYHDQLAVKGVTTSYAVVASCNFGNPFTPSDQSTVSMSHEIIESSTDPHPEDKFPGWTGFDPEHFAFDWLQQFQSEVGDACEFFSSSDYEEKETVPSFDFFVQRTWSNQSASAGHNPCVPVPGGTYFNVTPLKLTFVSVTLPTSLTGTAQPQVTTTRGVRILPGDTGTIDLGFYSDGSTAGPWQLTANEAGGRQSTSSHLTVSIDKTSGQNGEKAYATVTVSSAGPLGAELLVFRSTMGGVSHLMPIVVSSQ
jgi:hypothetical protein